MKMVRAYVLILVVFAFQVAACSREPQADDSSVDDLVVEEEEIPLAPLVAPHPIEGRYEFIMFAEFRMKLSGIDSFISGWEGLFTIDSKGEIKGDGSFHFNTEVYALIPPNDCGYKWNEEGVYSYDIGGIIIPGSMGIPIKIHSYSLLEGSEMDGPVKICDSKLDEIINGEQYQNWGETRRLSMFGAIIAPFNFGSSIIPEAGVPFEITFLDELLGEVTISITITYLGP